jgi:hypothetical protein
MWHEIGLGAVSWHWSQQINLSGGLTLGQSKKKGRIEMVDLCAV